MNKRLLWIGVIMGLAACGGDDDSSSSSKSNSSANNLSSNGSTNNSTNNVENNGPDVDAGSDSGFADADPSGDDAANNATSNNSSNNTTSTNNTTTNIAAGVTCMEILQCLLVCNTEDEVCRQDCKDTGSPAAHRKIDAYLGCVDTVCADATGVTELTECVLDKCSVEQAACLE